MALYLQWIKFWHAWFKQWYYGSRWTLYEMISSNEYWAWREAGVETCPITSMKNDIRKKWMNDEKVKKRIIVEQFSHGSKWTETLLIIFDSAFTAPSESICLEFCPPRSCENKKSSRPCNSSHYTLLCRNVALPLACANRILRYCLNPDVNEWTLKKVQQCFHLFNENFHNSLFCCLCWKWIDRKYVLGWVAWNKKEKGEGWTWSGSSDD